LYKTILANLQTTKSLISFGIIIHIKKTEKQFGKIKKNILNNLLEILSTFL